MSRTQRVAILVAIVLAIVVVVWVMTGTPWRALVFGPLALVGRYGMRKLEAEA